MPAGGGAAAGFRGGHLGCRSFLANGYYRRLFRFPVFPGTPRRYLGFPHPSTIFRLEFREIRGYFTGRNPNVNPVKGPSKLNLRRAAARSCVRARRTGGAGASPAHLSRRGLALARAGLARATSALASLAGLPPASPGRGPGGAHLAGGHEEMPGDTEARDREH